jgi:hypothetical protein
VLSSVFKPKKDWNALGQFWHEILDIAKEREVNGRLRFDVELDQ